MPSLSLDGERIHYEREGRGRPLLFIHSLGTAGWLWRAQMNHWRERFTIIAADCRGHGASSFTTGASMEGNARDLAGLMEALDLRDAVVIGLSMGGVIAAHLYALAPERIRAMVLADTFCHNPTGQERIAGVERQLQALSMAGFAREYAEQTLLPTTAADKKTALVQSISSMHKDAYLQTVRSLFAQDTRPLLAKVDVPVQVLVGASDNRTPQAMAEQVAQAAPRSVLEVVPDAAHLANLDNPIALNETVDRFLAGLEA